MKNRDISDGTGCVCLVIIVGVAIELVKAVRKSYILSNLTFIYFLIGAILLACIVVLVLYFRERNQRATIEGNFDKQLVEMQKQVKKEELTLEQKKKEIGKAEARLEEILKSSKPFSYSASWVADMKSKIYDESIEYLERKKHHAPRAADEVKQLKKKYREKEVEYRELLYKQEFLLKQFPELRDYLNNEENLIGLHDYLNLSEFDERDRAKDYISQADWDKLSNTDKYQIALDRYKKDTQKSRWVIGMEYEMYCAYKLRTKNLTVEEYGIKHGLEDLGRDIIAKEPNGRVFIIQCKHWSSHRMIHENVVCQLYGTAIEYALRNNLQFKNVIPVLMTPTELSVTANAFAQKLGVRIKHEAKGDFPMIKCNINGKDKIYHLPFDQQYYKTEIKNPGEFYAWTVKEAEDKGFRRAMRYMSVAPENIPFNIKHLSFLLDGK